MSDLSFSFTIPHQIGLPLHCAGRMRREPNCLGYLELVSIVKNQPMFDRDGAQNFVDVIAEVVAEDGIGEVWTFLNLQMTGVSTTTSNGQSATRREFITTEYIVGAHLKSSDHVITSLQYRSEAIRRFIGPPKFDVVTNETGLRLTHDFTARTPMLSSDLYDIQVIEQPYWGQKSEQFDITVGSEVILGIEFKHPETLENVKRLKMAYDSFFEIFFAEDVPSHIMLSIRTADNQTRVKYAQLGSRPPTNSDLRQFSTVALDRRPETLLQVLMAYEQWFEKVGISCNLFALSRSASFLEGSFLNACQAIEGFHRHTFEQKTLDKNHFRTARKACNRIVELFAKKIDAPEVAAFMKKLQPHNQMSLRGRLEDFTGLLKTTFRDQLAFPELANKAICNFRNDLTHGLKSESPPGQKIFELTAIMECMFLLKFLRICSFTDQQILKLTERHRGFQALRHKGSFANFRSPLVLPK